MRPVRFFFFELKCAAVTSTIRPFFSRCPLDRSITKRNWSMVKHATRPGDDLLFRRLSYFINEREKDQREMRAGVFREIVRTVSWERSNGRTGRRAREKKSRVVLNFSLCLNLYAGRVCGRVFVSFPRFVIDSLRERRENEKLPLSHQTTLSRRFCVRQTPQPFSAGPLRDPASVKQSISRPIESVVIVINQNSQRFKRVPINFNGVKIVIIRSLYNQFVFSGKIFYPFLRSDGGKRHPSRALE